MPYCKAKEGYTIHRLLSTKYESERYLSLERLKIKICSGYEDFVPAKMKG